MARRWSGCRRAGRSEGDLKDVEVKLLELAAIVQKSVLDDRPWPMAPPYIQSERDSIPLAVPGSRAAGGDGVVGSEPLTLAVPGSRAADGEGTAHIYTQWLRHTYSSACKDNCCKMDYIRFVHAFVARLKQHMPLIPLQPEAARRPA